MFHFEPSIKSKERFPEKIPIKYNKDIIDSQVKRIENEMIVKE